jgi:hypothetical protein
MIEAEYAPQKIDDAHWKVHKFDGHHGRFETTYDVIKGDNGWFCTCKAAYHCKHITLVMSEINPKKELF